MITGRGTEADEIWGGMKKKSLNNLAGAIEG
jgi:hypothetical protein